MPDWGWLTSCLWFKYRWHLTNNGLAYLLALRWAFSGDYISDFECGSLSYLNLSKGVWLFLSHNLGHWQWASAPSQQPEGQTDTVQYIVAFKLKCWYVRHIKCISDFWYFHCDVLIRKKSPYKLKDLYNLTCTFFYFYIHTFINFLIIWARVLYFNLDWFGTYYVAQAGLQLIAILLPKPLSIRITGGSHYAQLWYGKFWIHRIKQNLTREDKKNIEFQILTALFDFGF